LRDPAIEARVATMLDPRADSDERMDAVLEFSNDQPVWVSDDSVLDALAELASRPDEDLPLVMRAAETLALAWLDRGRFDAVDRGRFARLTREAQAEVGGFFDVNGRATWLDQGRAGPGP
jgi:hypothetical protein